MLLKKQPLCSDSKYEKKKAGFYRKIHLKTTTKYICIARQKLKAEMIKDLPRIFVVVASKCIMVAHTFVRL